MVQNPIFKFRQSFFICEKPVICQKNWKLWRAPTTLQSIFFAETLHTLYLRMSTKGCLGFFFILFRAWVTGKPGFCECVKTRSILILANNSSSKQNLKKTHTSFCRHWWLGNVCKISTKIIKVSSSCSSPKFSILQTKYLV